MNTQNSILQANNNPLLLNLFEQVLKMNSVQLLRKTGNKNIVDVTGDAIQPQTSGSVICCNICLEFQGPDDIQMN